MRVTRQAEYEVARPIEEVFDLSTACDQLPKFMLPFGIIPGVADARMVDAEAPKAGALRDISLTDGSTIQEQLLNLERPIRQHYRWVNPPAPPFSWLVRGAEGDWSYSATPNGTRVVWVYHFELTSPLAIVLALPVLALFRRWMQRSLERLAGAATAAELRR